MSCPHLNPKGNCAIASDLAGQPVRPHFSACDFCSRADKATPIQSLNSVTVSIALSNLDWASERAQQILAAHGHLIAVPQGAGEEYQRLAEIESGHGVGSQIWRLLASLGVKHTATCHCLTLAERMNALGPDGCRQERPNLVAKMRANAKQYGWGTVATAATRAVLTGLAWRLDLTDLYGSILDEGIRRAEADLHPNPG